ncbi:MAG: hypothetical protein OXG60_09630 [Chloroflexi bacterium]|nr:hypothetical protein [Chloroflexota bacterium]
MQQSPLPERAPQSEVEASKRIFAVLAYIVPVLGGIIGLAVDRNNPLTRNHAQQSIATVLALIMSFLLWAVIGYVIGLVPIMGPIVSISLFSLVVAMLIFLAINWIISLVVALRGRERTIPFANKIVGRLFGDDRQAKPLNATG